LGEILIQRDDNNRIVGLTAGDMTEGSEATRTAERLVRAVAASMGDYLHVPAEVSLAGGLRLRVDRTDSNLSREIDAILETLIIGLHMLAEELPAELVVRESGIGVKV